MTEEAVTEPGADGGEGAQPTPAEQPGSSGKANGADPAPAKPEAKPTSATLPDNWREPFINALDSDEDRETAANLLKNQTPDKFIKSYLETKRGFDRRVELPKDGDEEAQREFAQKYMGVPKDPADYEFRFSEDAPELSEFEQQGAEEFRQVAHRVGLNQRQMDELVKWNENFRKSALQGHKDAGSKLRETSEAELKRKWGPDYEPKLQLSSAAVNQYLGDQASDLVNLPLATGGVVGSHPAFVEMAAALGELHEEKYGPDLRHTQMERSGTMEELKTKEQEIKQNAMKEGKRPSDPSVAKQIQELRKQYGFKTKTMSPVGGLHSR